jgi:peptide/nickel transport system permease protein
LTTGFLSIGIALTFGIIASYYGGVGEKILFQLTNFSLIIPEIIFIMFISIHIEPSILGTILIITLFSWVKGYKIIKSKIEILLKKEKVKYTLLLKGSIFDLLRKIYPDLKPVIFTVFILQCNRAIMYETSLSFLGIGNPSIKTWGRMIKSALASEELFSTNLYLWYLFPVVLLIFLYLFSLSILGMEVEDER